MNPTNPKVEIKREEVEGAGQRISEIKGVLAQQLEVNEGHAVQESVWKQVSSRIHSVPQNRYRPRAIFLPRRVV
jgi:hypothetical protein